MRRLGASTLGAVILASLTAACSPAPAASGPPPSAPPGGTVIVAEAIAYDRTRIEIPADIAVPLLFENRDHVPHNVTVLDREGRDVAFGGEMVDGPGSRMYSLPALAAGEYPFRCDVHPYMTGTVVAAPRSVSWN